MSASAAALAVAVDLLDALREVADPGALGPAPAEVSGGAARLLAIGDRRVVARLERAPFDCLPRQALRTGLLPL